MSSEDIADLVEALTPREQEVLELLARDMSNRDVAEVLVLSIHTVKWHNRQIYGKLGVSNREEAVARARALRLVPAAHESRLGNLPAATMPFIGRETEINEICSLLRSGRSRLVTIVGPGGMGKTHLALEAARQLEDHFADGAAVVDLAPLQTVDAIVPSLSQALGFRPSGGAGEKTDPAAQLLDYVREKALLIVLDNFEHLQESVPLLVEILTTAPKTKLLVTSRARLRLHAAHSYRLNGLAISRWESVQQAQDNAAVSLFLHYGQRMRPGFELRETDLGAIWRILQLVQGMPLGIILAATWVEVLSLPQIAAEIEHSLDFLQADYHDLPQRQRSMRAVFESTWTRLSERDRELLSALSVFRGGCSLAAARSVSGAEPRDLRRLLDHSLVTVDATGRFGVHELLRQFAAEQLADSGIEGETHDRHSAYYITFLSNQQTRLTDARAEESQLAIEAEFQNCSAAWARAVEQQAITALGAAAFSLATFCQRTVRLQEGLEAIESAIRSARMQISQSPAIGPSILISLIRLLIVQCVLRFESGEFEPAEALGQEALALLASPELGNVGVNREKGLALLHLADVYLWQDRMTEAQVMLDKSISLLQAADDIWYQARASRFLGHAANRLADYDKAVENNRQAVQLLTTLGDRHEKAVAQVALGFSLSFVGEEVESEKRMRESIAAFEELGDKAGAAMAMLFMAETIAYRGRFQEARDLAHESTEVQTRLGRRTFASMSKIRWCLSLLHLGDYESVLALTPDVLHTANANRAKMNKGRALFLSGCAKLVLDRHEEALQEISEASAILRQIASWDYLCEALTVLSCAHARGGSVEKARAALNEASELTLDVRSPVLNTHVIAASALLSLATNKSIQAVELYAVASRDRFVAGSRWWEDVVGRHIVAASSELPKKNAAGAKARAMELDPWQLVNEILHDMRKAGSRSR